MKKLKIEYKNAYLMGVDLEATGKQLRKKRLEFNLTQEKLSDLFERGGDSVSKNAISTWETGKKLPTLSHVVFLAELYGCTIDELVLSFRRSRDAEAQDQFFFYSFWLVTLWLVVKKNNVRYDKNASCF